MMSTHNLTDIEPTIVCESDTNLFCFRFRFTGKEGVTTVAVKTLKENAADIERNDLHSELQV